MYRDILAELYQNVSPTCLCSHAAPSQRIRCHVRRYKQVLRGDEFQLFVENGNSPRSASPYLVLYARRRRKSAVPQYVIALSGLHTTGDELKTRSSGKIIATVIGNRQGTLYRCVAGAPVIQAMAFAAPAMLLLPPATPSGEGHAGGIKRDGGAVDIAAIKFRQAGIAKVGGVRQFVAVVADPSPAAAASALPMQGAGLLERHEAAERRGSPSREGLFVARSVQPVYDEAKKMFVMDFNKRVTKGSPKNCQLTAQDMEDSPSSQEALFLFGKKDKDLYAMDFAYPLSLVQAFSIAVACFDTRSFATGT
jgi:hypothetical protein